MGWPRQGQEHSHLLQRSTLPGARSSPIFPFWLFCNSWWVVMHCSYLPVLMPVPPAFLFVLPPHLVCETDVFTFHKWMRICDNCLSMPGFFSWPRCEDVQGNEGDRNLLHMVIHPLSPIYWKGCSSSSHIKLSWQPWKKISWLWLEFSLNHF